MKKYFMTVATVALFAIGFAASDEDESSNKSSNEGSAPQTEQKQESEKERQAREKQERENKKTELAKKGHDEGYKNGFKGASWELREPSHLKRLALQYYTTWYETPTNSEEKELCDIFVENYILGWEEGYRAQ